MRAPATASAISPGGKSGSVVADATKIVLLPHKQTMIGAKQIYTTFLFIIKYLSI
jgi:hypothetical protein